MYPAMYSYMYSYIYNIRLYIIGQLQAIYRLPSPDRSCTNGTQPTTNSSKGTSNFS